MKITAPEQCSKRRVTPYRYTRKAKLRRRLCLFVLLLLVSLLASGIGVAIGLLMY